MVCSECSTVGRTDGGEAATDGVEAAEVGREGRDSPCGLCPSLRPRYDCYCEVLPRVWARSFFTSFTVLLTVMSTRSLPISFVDGCGSPVRPLLTRGAALGSFARPRPPPPPRCGVSPRSRASRAAFHCSGVWPVGSNGTVL